MDIRPDMGAIKAAAREELGGVPGVEGFGVGDRALRIYVSNESVTRQLPPTYHGVTVECVVTGEILPHSGCR